jgi:quercetin dioxygenase-like cupin family protein
MEEFYHLPRFAWNDTFLGAMTVWKSLGALTVLTLSAQTPAPTTATINNDQVRVLLATEQPHRRGAMHEHSMNRVMIYLNTGVTALARPEGKVDRLEYKAGDVIWSPANGLHTSEQMGDSPVRIVEVELKNKPKPGRMETSGLDPLKADPKHYKLEFENDQVRVLRVRFGPGEKGVMHEHKLNHVVVYLNDQAKGKAGEFRFNGPETHTEENPLDHAVERIAIDIK